MRLEFALLPRCNAVYSAQLAATQSSATHWVKLIVELLICRMTPAIDCSRQTIHTIHIHIIHIAIVGWLKRDLRRRFDTLTGFHLPKPIQLELDLDPHWLPSPPWPPQPNEWHGMNWTSSHKFAIQNRLIDSHRLKMWCSEQIDLVMFCLLILCPTAINAFVYLFVPL